MIRVILVDDHALVRQGFRRILEEEPGLSVVGEAGSAQEGVELARQVKPDVVLMDMSMPDANGIHAAREILRERPATKILVLSMYSDAQYVRSALDAGVSGYILKSALETDLTRAVRAVAAGQQYLIRVGGYSGSAGVGTMTILQVNPCPVDMDGNGQVEPADVALFVSTWFGSVSQGGLAGDWDQNGSVTPADVAAFVNAWFSALTNGC